jgi:hypothetical protein
MWAAYMADRIKQPARPELMPAVLTARRIQPPAQAPGERSPHQSLIREGTWLPPYPLLQRHHKLLHPQQYLSRRVSTSDGAEGSEKQKRAVSDRKTHLARAPKVLAFTPVHAAHLS